MEYKKDWVGVDEAGRGPLAGPVVASAVWMPKEFDFSGIKDSKTLSKPQREYAFHKIEENCAYAIGIASVDEIDTINILQASLLAMTRAIEQLKHSAEGFLFDGGFVPYDFKSNGISVIDGDAKYVQISAAGIVAKVVRDKMMTHYADEYPVYGFEKHFGYATKQHLRSLHEYGVCPIHRKTFSPVKEIASQKCLEFTEKV